MPNLREEYKSGFFKLRQTYMQESLGKTQRNSDQYIIHLRYWLLHFGAILRY